MRCFVCLEGGGLQKKQGKATFLSFESFSLQAISIDYSVSMDKGTYKK